MDIIFENLGFFIFLVFFILPAIKKLKERKKEKDPLQAKRAGGKPAGLPRAADDDTRAQASRDGWKKEKSRQLREVLDKTGVSEGLAEMEKALKQGWEEFSGEGQKRPKLGEPASSDIPLKTAEPQDPPRESQTLVAEMEEQAAASLVAETSRRAAIAAGGADPSRGYGHQSHVSPLARIGAMSPLKQAVVWKEILDTPRGLSSFQGPGWNP